MLMKAVNAWRGLALRVMQLMASSMSILARLHLQQRSMKDRTKTSQKEEWDQQQLTCPHPYRSVHKGGNQCACWTQRGGCQGRIPYHKVNVSKKKGVKTQLDNPSDVPSIPMPKVKAPAGSSTDVVT